MVVKTMKNEKKYKVYKHTSPSGKIYIGITGNSVERRWQQGKNYKTSTYFNNAINKYGWENIKHEVLFTSLTREQAENKEIELIKKYKSNNPKYGYNIENGGHCCVMTKETKRKISNALKGKKYKKRRNHTEDEKRKISNTLKGRTSPMKGKHWTIEQRSKVGKAIVCNETGERFYSIREASRKTGCDRANISRVLRGAYKQTKGLSFSYE